LTEIGKIFATAAHFAKTMRAKTRALRRAIAGAVVFSSVAILACGARDTVHGESALRAVPANADASVTALASSATPSPTLGLDAGADASGPKSCPVDMVLVEGEYCPNVRQVCKRWIDPPGAYREYRCAEYVQPATCSGDRVHKRFCIDREEWVKPGDTLPIAHQSWTSAGNVCESRGDRLCLESEWQFACEGDEMRPYPYGFKRDATACNIDRMNLGRPNAGLNDLRAPISAYPKCLSPFGVHDMSGNVEEWATLDEGKAPDRSSMKGAWWLPGKNTCRASTLGHGEIYEGPQVGVRCCKDL
jgi:sulfatase modifying factor 1